MNKGERISRLVNQVTGKSAENTGASVADNPYYRAYFQCWNEQRYYEAHDVLEQVWLNTDTTDDDFFKGLIQAAGAFVHLQKNFQHPSHPKHANRLRPAVRLFLLAEKNLAAFAPIRHQFDVDQLLQLLRSHRSRIEESSFRENPWSPETAPLLHLSGG